MSTASPVVCGYCKAPAVFLPTSESVYRRDYGPVWICSPCDARVGCHPDGSPKGTLANAKLRELRKVAHAFFDPLYENWPTAYPDRDAEPFRKPKRVAALARTRAYEWLADQLAIPFEQTHIAMFDDEQCTRVVEIVVHQKPTASIIREWAKQRKVAA